MSQDPPNDLGPNATDPDPIAKAIAALGLPASYRAIVDQYWRVLAKKIIAKKPSGKPLIIGVNGAQGSGKSTLCAFLEVLLEEAGLRAITLSIDDLYLPKSERQNLAKAVHPLFATRGVPGTHDAALGISILQALKAGQNTQIPRFNKALDDRTNPPRPVTAPVDIILFEGWCVGALPQDKTELAQPVNALEEEEDGQGIWRDAVNQHLGAGYAQLFEMADLLIMLKVSDFSAVHANRALQERKLAQISPDAPALMTDTQITRFCAHYERITRAILTQMPERADIVIPINSDQSPTGITSR